MKFLFVQVLGQGWSTLICRVDVNRNQHRVASQVPVW